MWLPLSPHPKAKWTLKKCLPSHSFRNVSIWWTDSISRQGSQAADRNSSKAGNHDSRDFLMIQPSQGIRDDLITEGVPRKGFTFFIANQPPKEGPPGSALGNQRYERFSHNKRIMHPQTFKSRISPAPSHQRSLPVTTWAEIFREAKFSRFGGWEGEGLGDFSGQSCPFSRSGALWHGG